VIVVFADGGCSVAGRVSALTLVMTYAPRNSDALLEVGSPPQPTRHPAVRTTARRETFRILASMYGEPRQ
jgi:hypothetical protein